MGKGSLALVVIVAVIVMVAAIAAHQRGGVKWLHHLGSAIHGHR
jgi:hypothetical protein